MSLHFSYRRITSCLLSVSVLSLTVSSVYAAQPIDLQQQPTSVLRSMMASPSLAAKMQQQDIREISREIDFNHTLHIRVQQTYRGYPVMGGDAVLHVAEARSSHVAMSLTSMLSTESVRSNGVLYQHLDADLKQAPEYIFNHDHAQKALNHAASLYQQGGNTQALVSEKQSKLMVYVDDNQQARWVYLVSFYATAPKMMPAKPTYIIDANSFQVYQQWDDVQTLDIVKGGGFGGNKKTGMKTYDGKGGELNYPGFPISRDPVTKMCYLRDDIALVREVRNDLDVVQFSCPAVVGQHNNLYWHGGAGNDEQEEYNSPDAVNGGYGPSNDAYYAAHVVSAMYTDWYHVDAVVNPVTRKPMKIMILIHDGAYVNAGWGGKYMMIGDGDEHYYPLTTLDVIAHEVSHGFTMNHGVLMYFGQSGGINESFSDMAAQTAMFYATGDNNWKIGSKLSKENDESLRYMDAPKTDCKEGQTPGEKCSIDNISEYKNGVNVHYSSGIFNKVFYLISKSPEWGIRKAFEVMIHANRFYWTYNTDFSHAACGVLNAAKDFAVKDSTYNVAAVASAFLAVGIDTTNC